MSTLEDRTIAALRANHDQLSAQVRGFAAEDLNRQSGSSEWDVAQVLSHLGSGAEIMLAGLQKAIAGEGAPDQEFNVSVWDRWNAMSQQEKAEGFLDSNERLVRVYEDLDETARADLRIPLSFLPAPADIALLSGMRLNEAVLHAWDVCVAFDTAATLPPDQAGALIDQITGPVGFLIGFLGKTAAMDGAHTSVRVETTDPGRVLGLVISEAVGLGDAPDDADAVFTGPTESFLRLLGGRLDAEHTPTDVRVTGDAVGLELLRRVFPGM